MCEDVEIEKTLNPPPDPVSLRPATMDDADYLYRLRTDPETERQSLGEGPSTELAHLAWLAESLVLPHRALFVAECRGEPVGTGRIDFRNGRRECFLSLTIAPEHRGRSLATPLIRELCAAARALGARSLLALVKSGNTRSVQAFRAAGFRGVLPETLPAIVTLELRAE